MIRLNPLQLKPTQTIRNFNANKISKLIESIKSSGFNETSHIKVVKDKDEYCIVDGHHRVLAAIANKLIEVPCILVDENTPSLVIEDLDYVRSNKSHILYPWEDMVNYYKS